MAYFYSKAEHVNALTGQSVPDESIVFFGYDVEEDADNYYAIRTYPSDSPGREILPKSIWRQG